MKLKTHTILLLSVFVCSKTFAIGNETGNPLGNTDSIDHENCSLVLSTGKYMTLNPSYDMPWEDIDKKLEEKLKEKGYNISKIHKYTIDSVFGNSEIQEAKTGGRLAAEFRISCDALEGSSEHKCQASLKVVNPSDEKNYDVKDSNNKPFSKFKTYPSFYNKELQTGLSKWRPLSWQSGDVFDGVLDKLPKCSKKSLNPNEIVKSGKISIDDKNKIINDSARDKLKDKFETNDLNQTSSSSGISK